MLTYYFALLVPQSAVVRSPKNKTGREIIERY